MEDGGSYLGLCAGGYYGSARCEFEVGNAGMEVIGPRELAFYPGACRGSVFPGFVYNSEEGAVAAHLIIDEVCPSSLSQSALAYLEPLFPLLWAPDLPS